MACGSCGQKNKKANMPVAKATSGPWKLTVGSEVFYFQSRVQAQSANIRQHGGKGIVERA